MNDTRFQLVLDDIDAAIASRKAADAAIDDARTKLADMVEEGLPPGILASVNRAAYDLNTRYGDEGSRLQRARAAVIRAVERRH